MAKKKVVLNLKLYDPKRRQKALQIAAGFPGVTSAAVEDDDQIVLGGDGFDPINLTKVLRKRITCCVELISVVPVEEKKKPEQKPQAKPPAAEAKPAEANPPQNYVVVQPSYPPYIVPAYCENYDNSCTLM